jgi:hypothetical protein
LRSGSVTSPIIGERFDIERHAKSGRCVEVKLALAEINELR